MNDLTKPDPAAAGGEGTARRRALPIRLLLGVAKVAIAAFVVGEELARPLYRPFYDAFGRWAPVRRIEAWIGRRHRYLILLMLAVPFIGVEPLKVYGVVHFAEGHYLSGLGILAGAYLASFFLVERIYHAGRSKLLSIGWLAAGIGFGVRLRDAVLARVRATGAYKAGAAIAASAAGWARRLIAQARAA